VGWGHVREARFCGGGGWEGGCGAVVWGRGLVPWALQATRAEKSSAPVSRSAWVSALPLSSDTLGSHTDTYARRIDSLRHPADKAGESAFLHGD
jgi:hypothetical protein